MTANTSREVMVHKAIKQETALLTCDRNEDCKNGGLCRFDAEHGDSFCDCDDRHLGPYCTTFCPLQCGKGVFCQLKAGQEHIGGPDANVDHCEC